MQLADSEERFRDLFENTNDLIHFLSVDGTIQMVNNAWLTTLGYSFKEVKDRSIYSFIHPDAREKYSGYRESIIAKGKTWEVETAFITKSGEKVIVEGQIGCKYRDGKPEFTRGIFRNVTKRREAESNFKTIFNSAPDAVIVIDHESKVIGWNPKAEVLFGFSAQEIMGKSLTNTIIPERYREAHQKGMQHFFRTGEGPVLGKTIEITAINKAGNEFYINLSISATRINDNWCFIAFVADITHRRQTEETLIRKEAELLNTKVQDQKKDEFLSIASHELKTPLTSVKAYIQLLSEVLEKEDNKDAVKYVQKAQDGIEKLHSLVAELLDASRIQAGRLQLNITTFNFGDLVNSCIESIGHVSPAHTINVHGKADVEVRGDRNRLEQVLMNYLTNAAKYSPKYNKIVVNVTHYDDKVQVGVTDFGIGIPREKQDKVFERFYRVDNYNHSVQGLGIGLYISAEIIKRHRGKVWVESEEGKGSTFYFAIPVDGVAA